MQIKVILISGEEISFDVLPTDTVKGVRETVEELTDSSLANQEIIFEDKKLDNGESLGDIGIKRDSTLKMVDKSPKGNYVPECDTLIFFK